MSFALLGIMIFPGVLNVQFAIRMIPNNLVMNIRRCLDILELESVASPDELKQAYRDLVQIWHPDRFHGNSQLEKKAGEKLREITGAYKYLVAYFDPDQSKRPKTSAHGKQDDLSRLGSGPKTEIRDIGRPPNYSTVRNKAGGRHFGKFAGSSASTFKKKSSATKYVLLFLVFIVLGVSAFVSYRVINLDDLNSTSVGPESEVLKRLVINEIEKKGVFKESPTFQNMIQNLGKEIMLPEPKEFYEIYLDSGTIITTEAWWKEGDMIMYKKCGGSMGIESARVKKIIKR
jgi:curved DNA-binding protein CbpA